MRSYTLKDLPQVVLFVIAKHLNLKDQAQLGYTSNFFNQIKCSFWQQPAVKDQIVAKQNWLEEQKQDRQAVVNTVNRHCPPAPRKKR